MGRLLGAVHRLTSHDEGQDLLEYGFLAALIAIGAMFAVTSVGNMINTVWWQSIAQNF